MVLETVQMVKGTTSVEEGRIMMQLLRGEFYPVHLVRPDALGADRN